MDSLSAFGIGFGAGLIVSILDHAALAKIPKEQRLVSFGDAPYLFKFFGHPLAGAFLAAVVAPSRPMMSAAEAAFIGAAAPTLWRVIVKSGRTILRELLRNMSDDDD